MSSPKRDDTQKIENINTDSSSHASLAAGDAKVHISARTIIAVAAVCLIFSAQLLALVGAGLLARYMAKDLGAPTLSVWFSSCIVIVTLSTILPISQAADYWGRKYLILGTTAFGVVGSIMISRSQNIATAIAGFVVTGVALGCQSICYAIPSEVLHRKHRAHGQAAANVASGIGAVVGVLVGGALVRQNNEGWRIYWYLSMALFALGFIGVFFGYNPPKREEEVAYNSLEKIRRMDWVGSGLVATGLVLLVVALQYSGNPYPFVDGHVMGPFISGIVCLIGFGLWEWKGTSEGLLDHKLFGHRNFPLAVVGFFIEGVSFLTVSNYFAFEISFLKHVNTFNAGLPFAVLFLASMATAFACGFYTTWTRQIREPIVAGFLLLIVFAILMAFFKASLSMAHAYGYAVIGGGGLGFILNSVMVAAHMGTPADMISLSSGLATATRSLGGAIGLAINNAIFSNSLQKELSRKITAAVLPLGFNPRQLPALFGALASQNRAAVAAIPGMTPQIAGAAAGGLEEAYRLSFRKLWICCAAFSAAGALCSVFLKNPKAEFTEHIDAPVEVSVLQAQEEIEKKQGYRV
ncbi:major facilitator superfamily domain-containing protein [Paraphoma chrysanthemicola]|uniref:Major facilitator superfamily domain-containing protein n=1 Tax=Paraphoma chrysanthemicola TaxID=798071 RepID=A0A8K0QT67_9PLEO|nr:major facilitator superfamily domain-containing protein [Paraphoma chrysanthemicola]